MTYDIHMRVFVQLSSDGRTGIFSMVIYWKFAQGPGKFAFFVLGSKLGRQLALRSFFFLPGLVHRKAAGKRRGKERERKIK